MNEEALKDFWYFVNERHLIWLKRQKREPKPWTDDPILQQWKFCNVYRHLDKTSCHLKDWVIGPHWLDNPGLLLFNIFVFRAFNLSKTYDAIGWTIKWDEQRIKNILKYRYEHGMRITSGAYMIRGYENKPKWQSIPESLSYIWEDKEELITYIEKHQTLQACWEKLLEGNYWGWGPFTCYQIVLDLTYSPLLSRPADLNSWTYFGPGATRGLKQIWPEIKSKNYLSAALSLLAEPQLKEYMSPINLQDIEFCLCELGKYRRIKAGGKGKEHYAGT